MNQLRPSTVFALVTALAACAGGASNENPDKDESSSGASGVSGGSTGSSFGLPPILPPHSTSSSGGGVTGTVSATGTGGTTVSSGVTGTSVVSTTSDTASVTSVASSTTSSAPPGDAGVPLLATITLGACPGNIITVPVTIGGDQTFNMVLDTGSTTTAVAGSACTACGVSPEYTPDSTATDTDKTAEQEYGTDQQNSSGWSGEIYRDTITLGNEPGTPVNFVEITEQQRFFNDVGCTSLNPTPATSTTQGIFGIGPPYNLSPGTTAYLNQLDATWGVMNVFAFELCDRGGTMWIGGYNPASATGPVQYTPLLETTGEEYSSYSTYLASIDVNGASIPVSTSAYPPAILDTGTEYWILPPPAVTALATAIGSSSGWAQVFGSTTASSFFTGNAFDQCAPLTLSKAELDAMLPPLTLVFGQNETISVVANATDSYLTFVQEQWCSTLQGQAPSSYGLASIIGEPVLQSNIVVIDRANQQVGFAPHASGACN